MGGLIQLYDYQVDAINRMKNGCILCGGVGSGKSRTALAYYFRECGGKWDDGYSPMTVPRDLYIITTAHKRDTKEWEGEMVPFLLSTNPEASLYANKVVVDSWNNIKKYANVYGAFFIFDEQRVVGSGAWVKAFLKIARKNRWILLSATPGDTWSDYIPVFLANDFYRNKTEFLNEHAVYSRFTKYPKIEKFIGTGKLLRLRNEILVDMDFRRQTVAHHEDVFTTYHIDTYKDIIRTRTNPFEQAYIPCRGTDEGALLIGTDISVEDVHPIMPGWMFKATDGGYVRLVNKPIVNAAEMCYLMRKVVNSDESRQTKLLEILESHPRAIIFYSYNYERDILRELYYGEDVEVAEWNGDKHEPVPTSKKWVYLVQYTAGAEGWNCITTDTIIFFSQQYSYKILAQACGRIDRLNTPFKNLYYYHLKSRAGIDLAISRALASKKTFNESRFLKW